MNIDIFRGDAFGLTSLTEAINLRPYAPTRLGQLGLFTTAGITTTSVEVEFRDGVLTLVPRQDRGGPGVVKSVQKRKVRNFTAVHLPQRVYVMADEVQNVRAFGSQTEAELATDLLMAKADVALQDLDITIEYQRMGAVQGLILDASGETILDLFAEFGMTQIEQDFELNVDTTQVSSKIREMLRAMEAELGALMYTGVRVECSAQFFDAFITHPSVEKAYAAYSAAAQALGGDNRRGFVHGEVLWEEYRGSVNGTAFIAPGEAYAIPEGVPNLFLTKYAPANYMETVNTMGLPRYMRQEPMDFGKGIDGEVQSNPIHYSTRPRAIIKLVDGA